VYIADFLGLSLGARYTTAVEERVFVAGPDRIIRPDVTVRETWTNGGGGGIAVAEPDAMIEVWAPAEEIRQPYVAILDLESNQQVVTIIEVLSPSNKAAGPGRESYLAKQAETLASDVSLVEIDLLRHGAHVLAVPEENARLRRTYDYLVCVNRAAGRRDRYELYPRKLNERLPRIAVPLAYGDHDAVLDIQAVLDQAHEAGRYDRRIRYDRPCAPALTAEQQAWADGLTRGGPTAPAAD
jgi:hypothetical protein